MSSFLCVQIPQFPAWVMVQNEPALEARPFVVCEGDTVVAVSPQALDAGLNVGMTRGRVQSRYPQVFIVARDASREALAWSEVQRALSQFTSHIEPVEPGLVFAAVEAKPVLSLIATWNVKAGQSTDRASAHLLALTATNGEVRCLRPGREAAFADRVPLDVLADAGLSQRALERLHDLGCESVGELRAVSQSQLEAWVGPESQRLFEFSRGALCPSNLRPVDLWAAPEELTTHLEFEIAARESCHWEEALGELLARICHELGARNTQSLEVVAQTPIITVSARRLLKEPTSQARQMEVPALALLSQALQSLAPLPPVVLGLEVRLGYLTVRAETPACDEGQKDEKVLRLSRWKDAWQRVEARFNCGNARSVKQDAQSGSAERVFDCGPHFEAPPCENTSLIQDPASRAQHEPLCKLVG